MRLEALLDDSVANWGSGLPFPVASSLRVLEVTREPHERREQLIHVWEAYMAFLATALLSVTQADELRWHRMTNKVRDDFERARLDYRRASLGSWLTIIRVYAAEYRTALSAQDDDDSARQVEALFAGASAKVLHRLLSADVVTVLERVVQRRNSWMGHGGTTSRQQADEQCKSLESELALLRSLVGDSWGELLLVRAGHMRGLESGDFEVDCEIARGFATPFERKTIRLLNYVVEGRLYLVNENSGLAVPLLDLVQLRKAPDKVEYTAYFFNRTETTDQSRIVTYQFADSHDEYVDRDLATLIIPE
jgi:hypothetical protein